MAEKKLYRHQYRSTFSSEAGVGARSLLLIPAWNFLYLRFLLLYLQDTRGHEKLPAATLTSSPLHLGLRLCSLKKLQNSPACKTLNKCIITLCQ